MEKHFPPKRSFIKSLGHERDRENKIISCSTYYDRRQKTSSHYSAFRVCIFINIIADCEGKKKAKFVPTFPQLRVSRRFRTQLYCAEVIKWNKRRVDNTVRVHRTAERHKERSREKLTECVRRDERKRRRGGGEMGRKRQREVKTRERGKQRQRGSRFAPHCRLSESHISLWKHEPMHLPPSPCSSSAISWKGPSNELDVHLGALKGCS